MQTNVEYSRKKPMRTTSMDSHTLIMADVLTNVVEYQVKYQGIIRGPGPRPGPRKKRI